MNTCTTFELSFDSQNKTVYVDDVAKLRNLRVNLFIVLFADYITLVAPTIKRLHELLYSCQHVLDSLDIKINVNKSCCMRIGPRYDVKCKLTEIYSTSGQVIPWVNEIKYLGVFIVRYRSLKCSLDAAKQSFYRAANAIFGKIGRVASERKSPCN